MLSEKYNVKDIELILRAENPPPLFPPASDRAAWEALRAAIGAEHLAEFLHQAETATQTPIPTLTATHYLQCKRTGERREFEALVQQRRALLTSLALAECLEYRGRFRDALLDVAWAICEESSWAYPAHQFDLADPDRPIIDLFASATGLQLAELDLLLGADLDPALGRRIRYEVDRRLLTPYLTRHDHWWLHTTQERRVNNWTAVCNAGVVGAAIHLEPDPARLAEIIARVARSLDDYLATFDPDGGSTEGPGYWGYGFGNYVLLGQLMEHRTNGRLALLAGDFIRAIGRFPLRTALSPGAFVNFSDSDLQASFPTFLLNYLARRLDLPDLLRLYTYQANRVSRSDELTWALRNLLWRIDAPPAEPFVPEKNDWYPGMQWLISRYDPADPDGLVLAIKGGHNGEMHNQNDVGSIIVHLNGESVIADPGRGRYTKAYFSPERYNFFVPQSIGHSCPVVNGQAQLAGIDYAASVQEYQANPKLDLIALELRDAYPHDLQISGLRRVIAFHRTPPRGWVELVDGVSFDGEPGMLETVLTTFGTVTIEHGMVHLRGERGALNVEYDPEKVTALVETVPDVDLAQGPRDVQRVIFAFNEPQKSGAIRLWIKPVIED